MNGEFKWKLINDSINFDDKKNIVDFVMTENVRFTQGDKVAEFENEWSNWLGIKNSVFVNSGASANYIMASIMKERRGLGEVIVAPIGWVSDVSPLINLGFTPVFVDVSLDTMSITYDTIKNAITEKTVGLILVHCLGFNAMDQRILDLVKKYDLFFIEDGCEAHGATYGGKKIGTFGDISNFSFYFGHHITTIEGGMVCTNNEELYQYSKLFRSHGLTREASISIQDKYKNEYPELNPLFTFAVPGYNVRNQEFNAVLGLSQLKRLDYNIKQRNKNLIIWLNILDERKFYTNFVVNGNSNFALPLILREEDDDLLNRVCAVLDDNGVEYRRGTAGGGNQSLQPYLKNYKFKSDLLHNANHIHYFGLYVGNHPELLEKQIIDLCMKLNKVRI